MIHLCILYLDWRKQFIKLKKKQPQEVVLHERFTSDPAKKNNNDKSENFSLYLSIPQLIS